MKNYFENSKTLTEEQLVNIMNTELQNYVSTILGFPLTLIKSYTSKGNFRIGNTPFMITFELCDLRYHDENLYYLVNDLLSEKDFDSDKQFIDIFTKEWIKLIKEEAESFFMYIELSETTAKGQCTVNDFKRIIKAFDYSDYYDYENHSYSRKDFIKYCLLSSNLITDADEKLFDEFM